MKAHIKSRRVTKKKTGTESKSIQRVSDVRVRVGVIGFGYWGPNLVRNLQNITSSKIVAVCDLSLPHLKPLQQKYPDISITDNVEDLYRDSSIDAIVIATPVSTHYQLASKALKAGKHVLIEKPLAASSKEAVKLIALAKKYNKTLMVGHTFEFNPAVLKIKDIIESGDVGKVRYIDAVRVNLGRHQSDGQNVVWDLAPHDISIILNWVGAMPRRVSAWGQSFVKEGVEDVAFIRLEFDDKIIAHVHVSWLAPAKIRKMTVVGSKKMVIYDDLENLEKVKVAERSADIDESSDKMRVDYRMGDIVSPHLDFVEPLANECGHFVDCILEKDKCRTDGENGRRVVAILEAVDQSMKKSGKTIELKS